MSTITFSHRIPLGLADTWALHGRPGIVHRLTPGFTRMRLIHQANSLRDGVTKFALPGGITWVAQHQARAYEGTAPDWRRFQDVCTTAVLGALTGWEHTHEFRAEGTAGPAGTAESTVITDRLHTNLPKFVATRAFGGVFAYRQNQLQADVQHLKFARRLRERADDDRPLRIAVTGSGGLVGTQLCALLELAGHEVVRLKRGGTGNGTGAGSTGSNTVRKWNPDNPARGLLDDVQVLIHLGGHPIAGRFTEEHVAKVRDSRLEPTRKLAKLVAETPCVEAMVCASAVGFYGNDRAEQADETAGQGAGEVAEIVAGWEAATEPARAAGKRVVNVRSGLVLGGGSQMLDLLLASVRVGGGRLGDGSQHFPWVALDDVVDIYHRAAIDPNLNGPVNAVGPEVLTNDQFTKILVKVGGGLPLFPVPKQGPEILLGKQGAEELAMADQHVVPKVLEAVGHPFRYRTAEAALRHELGREDVQQV